MFSVSLLSASLLLAPSGATSRIDGAPAPVPPEVITRDGSGRVTVRAERLAADIRLDGQLDEAVYKTVPSASDFIQIEPSPGKPATEKTELWVFFDRAALYVVARCWDSQPERMVLDELRRDNTGIAQNEQIAFVLDTFYDRRNGFGFETTALGGRMDIQVTNESPNRDWNPIWQVAVGRFDGGWTLEAKVPFKSLRYRPGPDQIWGFNVRRQNRWKNEISYLSPVPPQMGLGGILKVSVAGTLVGVDAPPSRNLEIKPYVTSSLTSDATAASRASNVLGSDVGLDVKYGITQKLTADFTYRSDFAQVEADEQQVNLTRFSLSFPEKREFFLENRGLFSFGGVGDLMPGAAGSDVPMLFYSRRIGLNQGREVPVRLGGRLTGRAGSFNLGVIDIQTDQELLSRAPATNFTVLRLRRDVLRRSSIGAMFTGRSVAQEGIGSNEAYGVDGTFGFFKSLNFQTYLAQTRTSGRMGDAASHRMQMDYNGDRYGVTMERLAVGANFNPEVGFLRRQDIRLNSAMLRFSPRPRSIKAIRKFFLSGSMSYIENGAGRMESQDVNGVFQIHFANSDRLEISSGQDYEFLPQPFLIASNVTLPVGGYRSVNTRVGYNFGRQRKLSGNVLAEHGTFYSGRKTSASLAAGRIAVTPRFSVEPTYSINQVDLVEGAFTNHLVGSRVTYTTTPLMFTSALVQFNSATHTMTANVRFRWEYRPGSELFVVFNEQRDTLGRTTPALAGNSNRALIVKMNFLNRF